MFSKSSKFYLFLILFYFSFQGNGFTQNNDEERIINYLGNIKNFSALFIQDDGNDLSEGKISIGKSRLRIEYSNPSKILIILDEDKAMYYNHDLEEDEFFNPQNTSAKFFFEIFNNSNLLENSSIKYIKNGVVINKDIKDNEIKYKLKIYFEDNPLTIRKIDLLGSDINLKLSIFNHNHNEVFDKNYFKLINPSFFD